MENDEKLFERTFDALLGIITSIVIAILICMALSSCTTTRYVPVETVRIDTLYQAKVEHDSIHVHDSIYVNRYTQGDTVYLERTKWRTQYIEHLHTDTLYNTKIELRDVPVIVEKPLSWWQRICVSYGHLMFWLSIAAIAVATFVIIKRNKKE